MLELWALDAFACRDGWSILQRSSLGQIQQWWQMPSQWELLALSLCC